MMNKKEVFYFAGKCLALDLNPAFKDEIVQLIEGGLVDWEAFVVLCSNHLILPAIYLKFERHSILEYLPEDLVEHLSTVHQLNVQRNNQILDQVKEVSEALDKNNIKPIFLKGSAHLMDKVYSDVGERIMSDVDFLVLEKDYFSAAEVLKNIGYSQVYETAEWNDISKAKHYPRLKREGCVANIEIHRIPVDREHARWFGPEQVDSSKVEVQTIPGCFVPSDRDKIIHNFIHSQLANEGDVSGNVSLREIYDLSLLAGRYSLNDVLVHIKPEKKAIAYFALVRDVLGQAESFYSQSNFAYKILRRKHLLNLKSDKHERFISSLIFLSNRLFKGYIGLVLQLFYSKEKRKYFFSRISNKKWYANHVKLYTRFFKGGE